jgi:hypothetical protein
MARLEQLVDIEVLGHLVYPHFILPMKFKVGNAGCVWFFFFFFFGGGGVVVMGEGEGTLFSIAFP